MLPLSGELLRGMEIPRDAGSFGINIRGQRFPPELKDAADRQIDERRCRVAEVAERLGASMCSPHKLLRAARAEKTEKHAVTLVDAESEVFELHEQHAGTRRAGFIGATVSALPGIGRYFESVNN